jgi:hypothetical protein
MESSISILILPKITIPVTVFLPDGHRKTKTVIYQPADYLCNSVSTNTCDRCLFAAQLFHKLHEHNSKLVPVGCVLAKKRREEFFQNTRKIMFEEYVNTLLLQQQPVQQNQEEKITI